MGHEPLRNSFARPWMAQTGAAAHAGSSNSGMKGIIAGGVTGGMEIALTYPTEFVKTQLQLDEKGSKTSGSKRYSGMWDCAKKTVQTRGFLGLYKGLSVLIYGSIPKAAVRFGSYETLKKQMEMRKADPNGRLTVYENLMCGLGAGLFEAVFVVTPMETVKVKFINDQRSANPKFRGFFHGTRMIMKEQGLKGVYQGLTATMMKQGTNQAIRFAVINSLKTNYKQRTGQDSVPPLVTLVFGGIAGAASVFCNTPIDVVKTRMQGLEADKYKNTFDCFLKIWRNEGPAAFYKGTLPRLSRVCLDVGFTFTIYDFLMEALNTLWP